MDVGIFYGKSKEGLKDLKEGKATIGVDANSLYEDFNFYLQQTSGNLANVAMLIHRGLQKDANDRFADVHEIAKAIESLSI